MARTVAKGIQQFNETYAKNRIFASLIIVLSFTFFVYGDTVLASTVYTEGDFYYVLQDDAIEITGYFGSDSEVTLPSVIAGYPVCVIQTGAFTKSDIVKTINLPDTIMEIQEGAIAQGITVTYMNNSDNTIQSNPESKEPEEEAKVESEEELEKELEKEQEEQKEDDKENNFTDNTKEDTDSVSGSDESAADEPHLGEVEEVEINPLDNSEEHVEDLDKNVQVIDDKNEYTMTTDQDGTVTIQNQKEEKVYVDSKGTIKAGEDTIANIEKDGNVTYVRQEKMIWTAITAILVMLGIICVTAVIVRKKSKV